MDVCGCVMRRRRLRWEEIFLAISQVTDYGLLLWALRIFFGANTHGYFCGEIRTAVCSRANLHVWQVMSNPNHPSNLRARSASPSSWKQNRSEQNRTEQSHEEATPCDKCGEHEFAFCKWTSWGSIILGADGVSSMESINDLMLFFPYGEINLHTSPNEVLIGDFLSEAKPLVLSVHANLNQKYSGGVVLILLLVSKLWHLSTNNTKDTSSSFAWKVVRYTTVEGELGIWGAPKCYY